MYRGPPLPLDRNGKDSQEVGGGVSVLRAKRLGICLEMVEKLGPEKAQGGGDDVSGGPIDGGLRIE